jgi:iron complex outermembrane receptor protein
VAAAGRLVPSAADSALRAARGGADRATLRLSSTAGLGTPEVRALTVTVGAEHSTAREETNGEGTWLATEPPTHGAAGNAGNIASGPTPVTAAAAAGTTWWHNTGLLAQGQLTLRNAAFLTGGARLEHISGPANGPQLTLLPMLGGAWVRERGPLAMKLRAAYGRGIRPARTVARGATWTGGRVEGALTSLAPEEQSGVEAGVDLFWGARFGVHATRFDQRASGLVQPVAMLAEGGGGGGPGGPGGGGGPGGQRGHRIVYELQNVGAIANRGWELQATTSAGPLSVAAALSLVGSRVDRLATGYRGDLRAGDRILEVPARTAGVDASWARGRWSAALSLSRAADWVNYDRLALARAIAESSVSGASSTQPPVGAQLRGYWRTYDGVTRLGARTSLALWRGASVTLAGDNLLDRQLGEPDNVTVLPGRSVTLGVRAGF